VLIPETRTTLRLESGKELKDIKRLPYLSKSISHSGIRKGIESLPSHLYPTTLPQTGIRKGIERLMISPQHSQTLVFLESGKELKVSRKRLGHFSAFSFLESGKELKAVYPSPARPALAWGLESGKELKDSSVTNWQPLGNNTLESGKELKDVVLQVI